MSEAVVALLIFQVVIQFGILIVLAIRTDKKFLIKEKNAEIDRLKVLLSEDQPCPPPPKPEETWPNTREEWGELLKYCEEERRRRNDSDNDNCGSGGRTSPVSSPDNR